MQQSMYVTIIGIDAQQVHQVARLCGDVFVQQGGTLIIEGGTLSGGSVTSGAQINRKKSNAGE